MTEIPEGANGSTPAADAQLAVCPACRRAVSLDDDFARLRHSAYHLSCLLTALRGLGDEMAGASVPVAALRDGIEAVQNGKSQG